MPFKQRDIVKVKQKLPTGELEVHPFLIISCEASICQERERYYTGVMLTHMRKVDLYTFEIKKHMIDGQWEEEWSQARLYIIASFSESEISTSEKHYLGNMKKVDFQELLRRIKDYVFNVDNTH